MPCPHGSPRAPPPVDGDQPSTKLASETQPGRVKDAKLLAATARQERSMPPDQEVNSVGTGGAHLNRIV